MRISLGGGGTDLPSYYREHGGFLVSGAIDKYVYMLIHTVFQRRYLMKYAQTEEVDDVSEIRTRSCARRCCATGAGNPLEIASVADVPAGTGMGSSGAYTVCLLKALAQARSTSITPGVLAEAASEIEIIRVLAYYWRLIRYAATSKPRIFHILWNNKDSTFDRTLLMLYYRALEKVCCAHSS